MKSCTIKTAVVFLLMVAMLAGLTALLAGCGRSSDVDTSGMYLVVYDGNGGYLGNKTATTRKFYCQPGSKIPDYPVEYAENQYTVSSLGLAMREGYNLMGWYASDAATYTLSENGDYVYLAAEDGNGIYEINPSGEYVRKYESDPSGDYVYVFVEESTDEEAELTYVYIDASAPATDEATETEEPAEAEETAEAAEPAETEETAEVEEVAETEEPTEAEEVAETEEVTEAEEPEETVTLSVASGFYLCNGEETFTEIDDENLRAAYVKAYAEKTYTKTQIAEIAGWQKLELLSAAWRERFDGLERYDYVFAKAEEGDEALDHYAVESGYASLSSVFIEDDAGEYAYVGHEYVPYDADDEMHVGAERYSMSDRYVFTPDGDKTSPSFLDRYDATMDYWDFTTDTVTEEDCVWDGEKYVLTLNAHWVKKNTVFYHYENAVGQVETSTTRLLSDNRTTVPIRPGEIIGIREGIPQVAGKTFICWSKTAGEYDPWDFENDLFPEGAVELHLYAYYIDGTYTRIVSASGLSAVGKDPAGKYVLCTDIDLGGKEYTSSPLGLKNDQVFTGEFITLGKKITNFTFKFAPTKQQTLDSSIVSSIALFPQTCGAKISGLTVEGKAVYSGMNGGASNKGKMDINFLCSPLIGEVVSATDSASGKTVVENCRITFENVPKAEGALESEKFTYVLTYGDYAAKSARGALQVTDSDAASVTELDGSVRIVENKQ